MLILALATAAGAADVIVLDGRESTVVVSDDDATETTIAVSASAAVVPDDDDDEPEERRSWMTDRYQVGSTVTFLTDGPAQEMYARVEGRKDGYVEVAGRAQACGCWVGRVGAGFDVFGDGPLDLDLGLFLGADGGGLADGRAVLFEGPQVGTQVSVGLDGRHLVARYTWLAGLGAGPLDGLLTENQLQLGVKVARIADVYGEVLYLSPGTGEGQSGVGLGARLVF